MTTEINEKTEWVKRKYILTREIPNLWDLFGKENTDKLRETEDYYQILEQLVAEYFYGGDDE